MSTDVVMPQMGESVAEGTVVRWIKKVGDTVDRDEPLFEISTDKVDAEIPSPAAGVISEIRVKEGETVPVNSVVAVIGEAGEKKAAPAAAAPSAAPPVPTPQADGTPSSPGTPDRPLQEAGRPGSQPSQSAAPPASQKQPVDETHAAPASPLRSRGQEQGAAATSTEDLLRQRSSPLVRRIAQEHNVDISRVRGTGIAGRVTKDDILEHIAGKPGVPEARSQQAPAARPPSAGAGGGANPGADRVERCR